MPRGRIVEVFGPESSGKTTLMYHIMAEAQKLGGVCAFIDAEHAMDPLYAREIGVDIDELLVSQPDYGEQALEIADMLVRSGAVDVIAVDSVAALTPRAELEGQMGDQSVGLQARMMSQAMRKLAGNLHRADTLCLFTNQIREKVGVMFGSPETQPGGRALKFYSSQRLDIRRIETLKEGTEAVGNRVRVKVVKNKVARAVPPGGVRHRVRQGHLHRRLHPRPRHRAQRRDEVGLVLLLRRRAPRPGPQQRQGVPDEHAEIAKEIEGKIYEALGINRDLVTPDRPRRRRRRATASRRAPALEPGGVSGLARQRATDPRAQLQEALDLASAISATATARRPRCAGTSRQTRRAGRHRRRAGGARALGYLDDARYAQRFAEDRRRLDAWGAERIERRLVALGVAAGHRGGAVGARDGHDELTAAVELLGAASPTAGDDRERERALGAPGAPRLRARARLRRGARASSAVRDRARLARPVRGTRGVIAPFTAVLRSAQATDRPGSRESPANQALSRTGSFRSDATSRQPQPDQRVRRTLIPVPKQRRLKRGRRAALPTSFVRAPAVGPSLHEPGDSGLDRGHAAGERRHGNATRDRGGGPRAGIVRGRASSTTRRTASSRPTASRTPRDRRAASCASVRPQPVRSAARSQSLESSLDGAPRRSRGASASSTTRAAQLEVERARLDKLRDEHTRAARARRRAERRPGQERAPQGRRGPARATTPPASIRQVEEETKRDADRRVRTSSPSRCSGSRPATRPRRPCPSSSSRPTT